LIAAASVIGVLPIGRGSACLSGCSVIILFLVLGVKAMETREDARRFRRASEDFAMQAARNESALAALQA
jgi:hypothetical protein